MLRHRTSNFQAFVCITRKRIAKQQVCIRDPILLLLSSLFLTIMSKGDRNILSMGVRQSQENRTWKWVNFKKSKVQGKDSWEPSSYFPNLAFFSVVLGGIFQWFLVWRFFGRALLLQTVCKMSIGNDSQAVISFASGYALKYIRHVG